MLLTEFSISKVNFLKGKAYIQSGRILISLKTYINIYNNKHNNDALYKKKKADIYIYIRDGVTSERSDSDGVTSSRRAQLIN